MKRIMLVVLMLCGGVAVASDKITARSLTTAEKVAVVDTKISLCKADPNAVAAIEMKKYDPYIKACGKSMSDFLKQCRAKWVSQRAVMVAQLQTSLVAEKAALTIQVVAEPNMIVVETKL